MEILKSPKCSAKVLFTNSSSSLPSEIKLNGEYRTINCLNMPCRCDKSKYGMSPSVHLGILFFYFLIKFSFSFKQKMMDHLMLFL